MVKEQFISCRSPDDVELRACQSYVGGYPRLPPGMAVPSCTLCGEMLTFFFQVAFPLDHLWSHFSCSVFMCTSCVNESHFIPEMLTTPLAGADVSSDFVREYQNNFRIHVFRTEEGQTLDSYVPRILFKPISLDYTRSQVSIGKFADTPEWLLDDEMPGTVNGEPTAFLFQLFEGGVFETLPLAPPQMKLALNGTPTHAARGSYKLFLSNELYFFGGQTPSDGVYLLTQVP